MQKFGMVRLSAIGCAASAVAFGFIASTSDASNCFARFTYARATVKWGACPNGGMTNTTEDLETSPGTCAMSVAAATVSGQCAPTAGCGEAFATGSGNLESFFATAFTFPCSNPKYASAEIRYTALRRHKGSITLNGQVGPTQYFARGDYVRTGPYIEIGAIFLPMDITENGIVDARDLSYLLRDWGSTSTTTLADTNCDGIVDLTDLARLLAAWGTDGATP